MAMLLQNGYYLALLCLFNLVQIGVASVPLAAVVLTTGKDTRVFEKSIHSALAHLVDIDKFYVITSDAKAVHDKLHAKLGGRVVFVDEGRFPFTGTNVTEVMLQAVKEKGVYPMNGNSPFERTVWGRTGWFLQQLLKMYAGRVLGLDDFVIIDSDLIWFQNVTFLNKTLPNGVKVYNYASSGQYHANYVATLRKISGIDMFEPPKNDVYRSGICHHMVLSKPVLEHLMATSEQIHGGIPFWQVLLNHSALEMTCRAPRTNICGAGSTLSEYELYFNYARVKFPETIAFRPIMWSNGPMPGLLFWPPIDQGKISSDKHRTHYMNHRQSEVMQAFERQIAADSYSGYHFIGYHSYAKRRYYELVERKPFLLPYPYRVIYLIFLCYLLFVVSGLSGIM